MKKVFKTLTLVFVLFVSFFIAACGKIIVKFDTGESIEIDSVTIKGDNATQKIREALALAEKEHYEVHAYYDQEGTEEWQEEDEINKTITLYIKWIGIEYTVTYNANGGTGSMANQKIRYNEKANLTANTSIVKPYHTFLGWATSASATSAQYANGAQITMNEAGKTLYAVWQANNYNVIFNANGGTGTMANQSIKYGTSSNLRINESSITREGYSFAGWATTTTATVAEYGNGGLLVMNGAGKTLYAVWQANDYNVIFNANGGIGTIPIQTIKYATTENLTTNTTQISRTGYTFLGWATTDNANVAEYSNGASFTMDVLGDTLYAVWSANTYTIIYNSNKPATSSTISGTTANSEYTYDTPSTLRLAGYTLSGWRFDSWNTKADGTGTNYSDGQNIVNLVSVASGTFNLYAKWVRNKYDITFKNENLTLLTLSEIVFETTINQATGFNSTTLAIDIPVGKELDGWFEKDPAGNFTNEYLLTSKSPAKDLVLYAKISDLQGTITFNYNGATGGNSVESIDTVYRQQLGALPVPTKDNHTFGGWFNAGVKASATDEWRGITTLDALWIDNSHAYEINYDLKGGSIRDITPDEAYTVLDGEITLPTETNVTKDGYTFAGWKLSNDVYLAGVKTAANTVLTSIPQGSWTNINLEAQWTANTYAVTYNSNKPTSATGNVTGSTQNSEHTYDELSPLSTNGYSLLGWNFVGWNTLSDGTGTDYTNGQSAQNLSTTNNGEVTLFAKWAPNNYSIVFNSNRPENATTTITGNMNNLSMTYEISKNLTSNGYALGGWSFEGWATSEDGVVVYDNADEVNNLATTGNYNLYAIWSENTYSITYDYNEGLMGMAGKATYKSTDLSYTLPDGMEGRYPIKIGHDFAGWKLTAAAYIDDVLTAAGTIIEDIPQGSWGDIRIEAQWTKQTHTITFKIWDVDRSTWVDYILDGVVGDTNVLTGEYAASWTGLQNYSEAKYKTNMTKEGMVFDGWYSSSTNFTAQNKFGGLVGASDLTVYAHFIDVLSAPTNVSVNGTLISWDNVTGAEGYVVTIDGGEEYTTDINSFDSGLLMINVGTYEIKVKATSSYRSYLNEKIDSVETTYSFERTQALQNAIIRVDDGEGTFKKWVMFTGMSYTFNEPTWTFSLDNKSDAAIADVINSETTERITIGDVAGSFTWNIAIEDESPRTYLVQVVEDVSIFAKGTAYLNYERSISSESEYLDKSLQNYLVGTQNEFFFDLSLKEDGVEIADSYDIANEELITYSFEVYDNDAYRAATTDEVPTRNANGSFSFSAESVGTKYRATASLTYSRIALDPVVFEFVLNDAHNAFTHAQLKSLYADKNIHVINLHRDITPVLSIDQVQADGSPINTGSGYVFDSDANVARTNNGVLEVEGQDPIYKTEGNIYKRVYRFLEDDRIEVNGNYCTIDASQVPVVSKDWSTGAASGTGTYHQANYQSVGTDDYTLIRPHVGIFRYQVPQNGIATFNNLTIIGNKSTVALNRADYPEGAEGDVQYMSATKERATYDSGSYCGFYFESSEGVLNNVNISNSHHATRNDFAVTNAKRTLQNGTTETINYENNAKVEINYVKINNTDQGALYGWNGKEYKLFNSYITDAGGAAVQFADVNARQPLVIIDKYTVVDNYKTGEETWFTYWGMTALAQQLKSLLQPTINQFGVSAVKELDVSGEYVNLIFIYDPSAGKNEVAANCYCTTILGGTKVIGEDGRTTTAGGVTTVRQPSFLQSGDKRIAGGLYAFGVTPYGDTASFVNISSAIGGLLRTNKTAVVGGADYITGYLTALATSDTDAQAQYWAMAQGVLQGTSASLGFTVTMTEAEFATMCNIIAANQAKVATLASTGDGSNAVLYIIHKMGATAMLQDDYSSNFIEIYTTEDAVGNTQVIIGEAGLSGENGWM